MRLHDRVAKLEGQTGGYVGPAAWIICEEGETSDEGKARYEAEHGPLGDRLAIIWISTGVPRDKDSVICG